MKGTDIARLNLTNIQQEEIDSRTELARKASSVLGYDKLEKVISNPNALLFQLRNLNLLSKSRLRTISEEKSIVVCIQVLS